MAFDITTLVTDRTATDVQHWKQLKEKGFLNMSDDERAEWLSGNMKGAYNSGDLNRVGAALNYLRDRLIEVGYITYTTNFTAKTNWTVTSIPTTEDMRHYLNCVSIIREALTQFTTTPPTPTDTGALNYAEANNIERILFDVETLINNMLAARFYSGEVFSGEM